MKWSPVAALKDDQFRAGVATSPKGFLAHDGRKVISSADGKTWKVMAEAPGWIEELFAVGNDVFVKVETYDEMAEEWGPPLTVHRYGPCASGEAACGANGMGWTAFPTVIDEVVGGLMIGKGPGLNGVLSGRMTSADGGRTWTNISAKFGSSFARVLGAGLCRLDNGLQTLVDVGQTWRVVAPQPPAEVCHDPVDVGPRLVVACLFDQAPKSRLFSIDVSKWVVSP